MKFFATACFFLVAAMAAPYPGGYTAPGDYAPTSYGNGGSGNGSGNNGGGNGGNNGGNGNGGNNGSNGNGGNNGGNSNSGNNGGNGNGGNNGNGGSGSGQVCPGGLNSNPQCCVVDVLGIADLDCKTPSSASSSSDFKNSCRDMSRQAQCCTLPIAGQSLLCVDAI